MVKIVKIKRRVYQCCECGNTIVTSTNHRASCYPTCKGKCRQIINPHTAREIVLPKQTRHKFICDWKPDFKPYAIKERSA